MLYRYEIRVQTKHTWNGMQKRQEAQNRLDDTISKKGGRSLGTQVRSMTSLTSYEFSNIKDFCNCTKYLIKRKNLRVIQATVFPE